MHAANGTSGRRLLVELANGEEVQGVFALQRLELRKTRQGKDYIDLEICDRSGTLAGKVWDVTPELHRSVAGSAFVEVEGRIETYNDRRQVRVTAVKPARGPIDARDFLPHTEKDVGALFERLRAILATVRNPFFRRLFDEFLEDPSFRQRFLEAPGAVQNHHACIGGLLEHVVSLMESCLKTCEAYPRIDRDLLLAGAFLHDIGKVEELSLAHGLEYTDRGRLIGHISVGLLWIEERIRRIPGFPAELRDRLEHLVLSHHGAYEWGSPVLPLTAEAIALHALDDLDAKLWAFDHAVSAARENGSSFTDWSRVFGRRLYKPGKTPFAPGSASEPTNTPPPMRAPTG